MFIKLPPSLPLTPVLGFGGVLFVAQVVEGTSPLLAAGCFVFLLLSVLAFNITGGMEYPSGAYVAACSLLTIIVGMTAKAILGQPMQSNLLVPETSIMVYVVGMASMLAACYVNQLMRPKRALLDGMVVRGNANRIGFVCIIVGIVTPLILPGALVSTFNQANYFMYMAILIPVFETTRRSGGERSFNMVSFVAWCYSNFFGLVTFSKEGMFAGSAAWAVAAVAAGYYVSIKKMVIIGITGALAAMFLTPYSQVGRNLARNAPTSIAIQIGVALLSHPIELRKTYQAQVLIDISDESSYHLFDEPEGLLDRLNMFSVDDALIQITDKGQRATPANLWSYFVNLVPRYLYPDKPVLHWGNVYAKSLGLVGEADETTGISFSPFADGYHTAGWAGVTLYSFFIFLFGFFFMDAIGGNTKHSIWALLYVLFAIHQAPEALLGGPVYGGGTYSVFVIGVAFVCAKMVPILINMVSAPDQSVMKEFDADGKQVQSA
jgi:hypothetical protein